MQDENISIIKLLHSCIDNNALYMNIMDIDFCVPFVKDLLGKMLNFVSFFFAKKFGTA